VRRPLVLGVLLLLLVMLVGPFAGCAGSAQPAGSSSTTAPPASGPAVSSSVTAPAGTTTSQPSTTVPAVDKTTASDGAVTLGNLSTEGFALDLPGDAYAGVAGVSATRAPAGSAPAMEHATILADGYAVDTGGVGRLEDAASLTLAYDPAKTPDPYLLALGYYTGTEWTYIFAASADTAAHTVTFPIFHFSEYYPSQFKNELEAAKYYAGQLAAQKVLGERGGDPRTASGMLAGFVADKLGLGADKFTQRMLKDIAADQEIVKAFDQYMTSGWTDTGYALVMNLVCNKVATKMVTSGLSNGQSIADAAAQDMWDVLKIGNSTSKVAGFLFEGDVKDASKELFDLATDYTGSAGKAIKYVVLGTQNAVDVWRDSEVEKAFKVYVNGTAGHLFGYGDVEPNDFDGVWNNMGAAARQLCLERIKTENEARATAGVPALTPAEEDFYREKVKQELKREFDRRVALDDKIKAQEKDLDAILNEPYFAELFAGDNAFLRDKDALDDTVQNRLVRFNHLIERIMTDLKVTAVYSGQQQTGDLNGRISSVAMADMLRGYFEADTQKEAEEFLQDYYAKLGIGMAEFAGIYKGVMPLDMGTEHADVPWYITVDTEGRVVGGLEYTWSNTAKTTLALTGHVSDDGRVTASGTGVTSIVYNGQLKSSSGPVTFSGQIVNGVLTCMIGDLKVTATRQ
jgi:hypothetical protein